LNVKVWRKVPVDSNVLGSLSAEFVPSIRQVVIQARNKGIKGTQAEFEKMLYDVRREIQGYFRKMESSQSYVCSLSSKTIVYKGLLLSIIVPCLPIYIIFPSFRNASIV
jgi:glutamate synthase (NADPH) large chain